jgi:hypothetical protein
MKLVEYASLLNTAMMRYLIPNGALLRERFMGLTKSFTSVTPARLQSGAQRRATRALRIRDLLCNMR